MENKQKVIVSLDVLNNILSFLSERPYREVVVLIDEVKKDVSDNSEEQKRLQEEQNS